MKKKKVLYILLALLLLYILWLSCNLIRFKTYKSLTPNANLKEIVGSYHMHSVFSDGRKHPDKIAKIASQASLDFIILTDHGSPNYRCLQSQGWKEGVLVLAGSELSVSRGHMTALAFIPPFIPFSQNAEEAAQQVAARGGFSIIAHPYSKVSWTWGESSYYQGLEILNSDSILRKKFLSSLPYLPAVLVKPEYALLKMVDYPQKNLKKWDELNNHQSIYGYFAVDAHFLYRPLFSLLRLHLRLENPLSSNFQTAKNQVYETLRKGKFYNAIDAAAEAKGFRFWAKKGKKIIQMGEIILLDSPVILYIKAPFSFAKEIHLIHNGKTILRSPKRRISFETEQPGTYRVEVLLKEKTPLAKNVPWIISNPIFLKEVKE